MSVIFSSYYYCIQKSCFPQQRFKIYNFLLKRFIISVSIYSPLFDVRIGLTEVFFVDHSNCHLWYQENNSTKSSFKSTKLSINVSQLIQHIKLSNLLSVILYHAMSCEVRQVQLRIFACANSVFQKTVF